MNKEDATIDLSEHGPLATIILQIEFLGLFRGLPAAQPDSAA